MSLSVRNLTFRRRGCPVLSGISLSPNAGELTVIVGANGAGKSTLMQILAGDLIPDGGAVELDGRALAEWSSGALARRRAVMPQSLHISFPLTVGEVVALGRLPFHHLQSASEAAAHVTAAMQDTSIIHLRHRLYPSLSGGEQQRAQMARALAQCMGNQTAAPILLLDEPTSSLDLAHAHHTMDRLRKLASAGVCLCMVLHDLNLAYRYADRVFVLANGTACAYGPAHEALTPEVIAMAFSLKADIVGDNLLITGPIEKAPGYGQEGCKM